MPTGNLCPEPDMLTVGTGAFIAPGVDFFTHKNTGHTSCFRKEPPPGL
jgi:hypothetical protein